MTVRGRKKLLLGLVFALGPVRFGELPNFEKAPINQEILWELRPLLAGSAEAVFIPTS